MKKPMLAALAVLSLVAGGFAAVAHSQSCQTNCMTGANGSQLCVTTCNYGSMMQGLGE